MSAVATPAPVGPRAWRWVARAARGRRARLADRRAPRAARPAFEGLLPALLLRPDPPEGRVRDRGGRCSPCFQLLTAAWIFRKLPWPQAGLGQPGAPLVGAAGVRAARCRSPTTASSSSASRDPDSRVFAHSLLGCAVYGAFAAKVTIVRLHRFPKPVLPIAGGLLFAVLIGVWYTSALWLYRQPAAPATSPGRAGAAGRNAAAGRAGVHLSGLQQVPHARRRKRARADRAEPRPAAADLRGRRGEGHEGWRRHARVRRPS